MGRAADSMEQAGTESADDPVWISHFDHAYLADELAHCHRDLGRPAQAARYAEQALAGHPVTRVRRRAIGLTLLAAAQVQERDIERACHTGTRAAELLGTLRSSRGTEYLDDLQQRLTPFQDEPVVREFGARLELRAA